MDVAIIETSGLGHHSYLANATGVAIVIDPQRDTDRILAATAELDVTVTQVSENRFCDDYVGGSRAGSP